MRRFLTTVAMAAVSAAAILAVGIPMTACSGSGSGSSTGGSSGGSSGSTCTNTTFLQILFNPMYSAYDGTNTYQVPAVVSGVDQSQLTWSSSDPTKVTLAEDFTTGGVMITTKAAGTVTITAQITGSTVCGQATLTIDQATTDQWNTGSARYNDGIVLHGGPGQGQYPDGGGFKDQACTDCHGPTAVNPQGFNDIAHTPEQTAGFSDSDLANIFQNGIVADGGYFDSSIISYQMWQNIHAWTMTSDEAQGMVVYLRSLTPTPQDGTASFGGHYHYPDGGQPNGYPDGGGHHHHGDGGFGGLPDGG